MLSGTRTKQPTFFIIRQRLAEFFTDGDRAVYSAFHVGVCNFVFDKLAFFQAFGLRPSCASGETDSYHGF